jgi:hypothetical protein
MPASATAVTVYSLVDKAHADGSSLQSDPWTEYLAFDELSGAEPMIPAHRSSLKLACLFQLLPLRNAMNLPFLSA